MIATAFSILLMGTVLVFSFLALRHFKDELRKEKLKDDKKPLTNKMIEEEGLIQHPKEYFSLSPLPVYRSQSLNIDVNKSPSSLERDLA